MAGLGVMGRNIVLNMADHGYSVAGYDKDQARIEALRQESTNRDVRGAETIQEFDGLIHRHRTVTMLVPAGPTVDFVIADLYCTSNTATLIIDAGNFYFKDRNLRAHSYERIDVKGTFHTAWTKG